jgi:DNA-binding transcriptional ArsR family regulator
LELDDGLCLFQAVLEALDFALDFFHAAAVRTPGQRLGAALPDGLLFTDLKVLCNLTDGNLSRHLTVLQDAGVVEIHKGYKGRRPQTLCRLTDTGRRRFLDYIEVLEHVLADAVAAAKGPRRQRRNLPDGFSPA